MDNKAYVLQVREKEKWYILDKKTFAVLGNCSDNYEIWKKDLESRRLETRLCTIRHTFCKSEKRKNGIF